MKNVSEVIQLYEGWNGDLKKDSANIDFYYNLPATLDYLSTGDCIDMGYPVKDGVINTDDAIDRIQEILENATSLTLLQGLFVYRTYFIPGIASTQERSKSWGNIKIRTLEKLKWLFMGYPFYCANCGKEFIPQNKRNDLCRVCNKDRVKIRRRM